MSDDLPANVADTPPLWPSLLRWLLLSAVLLTAWTILCVHVPSRVKLLGFFAVVYGLSSGLILKHLARLTSLSSPRVVTLLTCMMVVVGQVALSVESYRIYCVEAERALAQDQQGAMLAALLSAGNRPDDPESSRMLDEMRASLGLTTDFQGYLARRVSQMGRWNSPWPELVWGLEIVVGAIAAGWIASRPVNEH